MAAGFVNPADQGVARKRRNVPLQSDGRHGIEVWHCTSEQNFVARSPDPRFYSEMSRRSSSTKGDDILKVFGFGVIAFGALALLNEVAKPAPPPPVPPPPDPRAILLGIASTHLAFVCRALGVPAVPLVADDTINNALSDGKVIRVNLGWIKSAIGDVCNASRECLDGVVLGVVAHEVAHHIGGDAYAADQSVAARHGRELQADRIAGFVLARAGISPDHFARLLVVLSVNATSTHPQAGPRLAYLVDGHNRGRLVFGPAT